MESIREMNRVVASLFQVPKEIDESNLRWQELTNEKRREVTTALKTQSKESHCSEQTESQHNEILRCLSSILRAFLFHQEHMNVNGSKKGFFNLENLTGIVFLVKVSAEMETGTEAKKWTIVPNKNKNWNAADASSAIRTCKNCFYPKLEKGNYSKLASNAVISTLLQEFHKNPFPWMGYPSGIARALLGHKALVKRVVTNTAIFNITLLAAKVIVTPNTVNVEKALGADIRQNPVPLLTVMLIFLAYLVLALWAVTKDKADRVTEDKILILPDKEPCHQVCFAVTLYTGSRLGAGTTADVFVQLVGQDGTSDVFCLRHSHNPSFHQGSTDTFLLTVKKNLGDICALRVWHNNKGSSPSWFLSRAKVENVDTKKTWFFICRKWLALNKDDGLLQRTFLAMSPKARLSRIDYFWINLTVKLRDGHLWFSVFAHTGTGTFSRIQRLSCCLAILLLNLLVNFMFFGTDKREESPSPVTFWRSMALGAQRAFLTIPLQMIIIASFRYSQKQPWNALEGDNVQRQKKRPSTIPLLFRKTPSLAFCRGCVCFSWTLIIALMGLSSFVIVLYGLSYGQNTSRQWLFKSAISFVKNVFFFQPLKILFFSALSMLLPKYCRSIPRPTQENYFEFKLGKAREIEEEKREMHSKLAQIFPSLTLQMNAIPDTGKGKIILIRVPGSSA